jgi:uncharacterized OB-fold protein
MSDPSLRMIPTPTGPSAELYAYWAQGELRLQRCADCAAWRHPPRFRCAACGSDAVTWDVASGRARVFSWTITHRPVDPAFEPPYAIVVAELEEGPRLVGNLAGIANEELRLDLPVVVELEPVNDAVALVTFRPA